MLAPAAGPDTGIMDSPGELGRRLGEIEKHIVGFNQRAAHRELVIDHLHEENQRLREGVERIVLEPVVTDLIYLYDQLEREARQHGTDGPHSTLLRSFANDVLEILGRCGIESFSAVPGESFQRGVHRAVKVVACDDGTRHNTVAEVTAVGFRERDSGLIRRPVHAHVSQHAPGTADVT